MNTDEFNNGGLIRVQSVFHPWLLGSFELKYYRHVARPAGLMRLPVPPVATKVVSPLELIPEIVQCVQQFARSRN